MSDSAHLRARSPWSPLHGVTRASVDAARGPVTATLRVPGSKSYTNRALIIAALARGQSTLRGILRSDDSYWCLQSLQKIGVASHIDETIDTVTLGGCDGHFPTPSQDLFIGSAGTVARFLPGALAASSGGPWRVDGSEQMRRRPIGTLITALRQLGGQVEYAGTANALPIDIRGAGLAGGRVQMSGSVSSQFISGVLIASPYARAATEIDITDHIVQHAYVMMTIDMMRDFGVDVEHDAKLQHMHVAPQRYVGRQIDLEADASTAGYFLGLAALTEGRVHITNLRHTTRQPDIGLLHVFERMGCTVERRDDGVSVAGPPQLRGGFTISMKEMSDQTPTVAAIAPFADGPISITDVAHIRHHESDRIAAICDVLRTLGLRAEEHADGLTVYPGKPRAAAVSSHDDHRIAMSTALIATQTTGVEILDPGCVSKTCPTFFAELEKAGIHTKLT